MSEQPEDADQEVLDWAREMWPELTTGRLSISPYGAGVALLRETPHGTMQILIAVDHRDGRNLIGALLRHHHIVHEVKRLSLEPKPQEAVNRFVGSLLKPLRPQAPAVPQPYLQSPSALPPAHDDLSAAVDFAARMRSSVPPPPPQSDDALPSTSSEPPRDDNGHGGGD